MFRASRPWFCALAGSIAVVVLATGAATAAGSSIVITNGYYNNAQGVAAPRHSLTKVDVTNTSASGQGFGDACEDAINSSGGWAQDHHYCAIPGGDYQFHTFCGCELRYGWNGPYLAGAWMVGVEYY